MTETESHICGVFGHGPCPGSPGRDRSRGLGSPGLCPDPCRPFCTCHLTRAMSTIA